MYCLTNQEALYDAIQTNDQCECFNSTLISMQGTLDPASELKWPEQLAVLVHAYNCARSTATGFKPFFLMHGHQPMLPIDVELGVMTPDLTATTTQICATVEKSEGQRGE